MDFIDNFHLNVFFMHKISKSKKKKPKTYKSKFFSSPSSKIKTWRENIYQEFKNFAGRNALPIQKSHLQNTAVLK